MSNPESIESLYSRSHDRSAPLWRFLFRPMLFASLALHALVLSVPLPSTSEAVPEAEAEPEPEESIQLSSLVASPVPKPVASPLVQPAPTALPKPVSVAPSLIARPRSNPVPNPAPLRTPSPSPLAAAASPAPTVAPSSTASVPPSPVFDPSGLQADLQASLQGTEGNTGLQPFPGVFVEPLKFYVSEEPDAEQLPGITTMQWFNNMQADSVFAKLQDNYQSRGFTFNPLEDYGGGKVYALKTAEGQTISFINVVPGKGGASTVVVTWEYDPNSPPVS